MLLAAGAKPNAVQKFVEGRFGKQPLLIPRPTSEPEPEPGLKRPVITPSDAARFLGGAKPEGR